MALTPEGALKPWRGASGKPPISSVRLVKSDLLLEVGSEEAQPLGGEWLPETAGRDAEMGLERARKHLRAREAVLRGDIMDRNVAVEERIARRLKPHLEVIAHRRLADPVTQDAPH